MAPREVTGALGDLLLGVELQLVHANVTNPAIDAQVGRRAEYLGAGAKLGPHAQAIEPIGHCKTVHAPTIRPPGPAVKRYLLPSVRIVRPLAVGPGIGYAPPHGPSPPARRPPQTSHQGQRSVQGYSERRRSDPPDPGHRRLALPARALAPGGASHRRRHRPQVGGAHPSGRSGGGLPARPPPERAGTEQGATLSCTPGQNASLANCRTIYTHMAIRIDAPIVYRLQSIPCRR